MHCKKIYTLLYVSLIINRRRICLQIYFWITLFAYQHFAFIVCHLSLYSVFTFLKFNSYLLTHQILEFETQCNVM